MASLLDKTNQILNEKNSKLLPENIKENVTILGVTGTLTPGSTTSGVKLFETIDEMKADPNPQEGDLAVVYRSEVQNTTVDSKFQVATFPETVVLDTSITGNVEVRYRAVDSSVMFDCMGSLDSSRFMMDCYTDSGSIRIEYTSSDGITYTRTDTTGNPVDFGTEIYYEMAEYWNDAIGKFIQVERNTFEGLYSYGYKSTLDDYIITICKFLNGDKSALGTETATFDFSDIPFSEVPRYEDNDWKDTVRIIPLTWEDYILQENIIHKVTSCWIFNDANQVFAKNNTNAYYDSVNTSNNAGVIHWTKNDGVAFTLCSNMNSTAITSTKHTLYGDYELKDKYIFEIKISDNKFQLINDDTIGIYYYDTDIFPSTVVYNYVTGSQNYSEFKILAYNIANSQLTSVNPNELLPNTICYGKNGVVISDGNIQIPNDTFLDTPAMLWYNIQKNYDNIEPKVLTDDNKVVNKSLYFIPTRLDGTPLVDTSNVTNMNRMFENCKHLANIPKLDTSKVVNMSDMLKGCSSLLTVAEIDTSKVTNMNGMFYDCTSLKSVPLLNTSSTQDMGSMFGHCASLVEIPQFDTSNVTKLSSFARDCSELTILPMLNTTNVTTMGAMVYQCNKLPDESLNNILAMCINAKKYTETKTLKAIGLSSEQATRCQTLSNYSAFTNAGWTTGY